MIAVDTPLPQLMTELHDVLARQSLRFGDFTLTSGAKSKYYYDGKATTLSPLGAQLVGETLFRVLSGLGAEAVGGLTLGADFIATAVALVSQQHGRPIYGFIVRDAQKRHGTRKSIEESFHPDGQPLLRPGRRVAIVDDVVTKGGSMFKAIQEVRERECEIVAVATLVDRGAGGGERIRAEGLPYYPLFHTDENGRMTADEGVLQLGASA